MSRHTPPQTSMICVWTTEWSAIASPCICSQYMAKRAPAMRRTTSPVTERVRAVDTRLGAKRATGALHAGVGIPFTWVWAGAAVGADGAWTPGYSVHWGEGAPGPPGACGPADGGGADGAWWGCTGGGVLVPEVAAAMIPITAAMTIAIPARFHKTPWAFPQVPFNTEALPRPRSTSTSAPSCAASKWPRSSSSAWIRPSLCSGRNTQYRA